MYRLHIDIPIEGSREKATAISNLFITWFLKDKDVADKMLAIVPEIKEINIRLGHDEDRQKSNYLLVNENGHVNNKKMRINYD